MKVIIFLLLLLPLLGAGQNAITTDIEQRIELHGWYYDTLGNFYGFLSIEKDIPMPRYDDFRKTWYDYSTVEIRQVKSSGQWYYPYKDSNGVERRKYLGWRTRGRFEGCTIFCNKDSTQHWIWQLSKETKLPYKLEVPEYVVQIK